MDGFYRVDQDGVFMFARWVRAPDYSLDYTERDTYTYPTLGGWVYLPNREAAVAHFGVASDAECMGYPEEVI